MSAGSDAGGGGRVKLICLDCGVTYEPTARYSKALLLKLFVAETCPECAGIVGVDSGGASN